MVRPSDVHTQIDAEAAVWLARLQGDDAAGEHQEAFKRWLDRDPAHGDAFERATDAWMLVPGAARFLPRREDPSRSRKMLARPLAIAASLALVAGIGALTLPFQRDAHYRTALGEQHVSTLNDGSRVALNTDSEIDVRYAPGVRHVRLERGEAMFEVAHDPARPFVVEAGTKRIQAIGTAFVVRRRGGEVTVTLVEGKVLVTDTALPRGNETMLAPGERLLSSGIAPARIDRQSVESATAWRRGQIMFDDTPLADAVAEMARYGGPVIAVNDPRLGALPVSGVFAANATEDFAHAVAALHDLDVETAGGKLEIIRKTTGR